MDKTPQHVAIVMDGNGRWARKRLLPRAAGHRAGAKAVRKAVEFCVEHNIGVLTLFALSVENRKFRPSKEVQLLMSLFLESLEKNTQELHKNNVCIRIMGDTSDFDAGLLEQIRTSEKLTANNTGLTLVVAINYSGRWDITEATRRISQQVAEQQLSIEQIDESLIESNLCLAELPPPDLLIRTSGEQRISNFMLWQFAYTELYFTDVLWPDFSGECFAKALTFYAKRERRFGKTREQIELQDA